MSWVPMFSVPYMLVPRAIRLSAPITPSRAVGQSRCRARSRGRVPRPDRALCPTGAFGGFGTTTTTAAPAFSFSAPTNTGTSGKGLQHSLPVQQIFGLCGCCALFLNNHFLVSPGLFGATQNKGFGFGTSFGTGTGTGLGSGLGTGLGFGGFGTQQQQQQQTSEYGLWIYPSLSSESARLTPSVTPSGIEVCCKRRLLHLNS